jgi:ABC-type transporter MlaC component
MQFPLSLKTVARLPLILLIMAVFGFATPQAVAAPACAAASYVKSAGQAYDRAARAGTAAAFATAASRYTDLQGLSYFALGRYRSALPKNRQSEYLNLTRRFVGDFMLEYGKGFEASTLEIVDCKTSGGNIVVNARLTNGGKVIFRISKAGGGFTVKDMNMKGIWLAQQMRSAFVGTLNRSNGDFDALFNFLKS